MEHAILVRKTGEKKYVSIKTVKDDFGIDIARRQEYQCPSELCRVKMIPVFPKRLRRDGKEAHSHHFRAKPLPHTSVCSGDGERTDLIEASSGNETDQKPRHWLVQRGDFPMCYVKRSRAKRFVPGRVIPDVKEPESQERTETESKKVQSNRHISKPETGHIRRIVEAYENPPNKLYRMGLSLPGCPARSYAEAFVDVTHAIDTQGRISASYIFKGSYAEHLVYGNNAISITLAQLAPDGRRFTVWVKSELGPEVHRKELKKMLWQAAREKTATIYVFGRFQAFNDLKYSLEIEAFGDLWITFPSNSGISRSVTVAQPHP